jgi:S1-C subfamily serine protease
LRAADRQKLIASFELAEKPLQVRTVPVKVLFEDANSDLAFLTARISDAPCASGSLYVFRFFAGDPKELTGEPVAVIGHPKIAEEDLNIPILRTGIVSSSEVSWQFHPMFLLDLVGVPGFSGSPVILLKTGETIGVVFGPGPTQRTLGFEWATPITADIYNKAVLQGVNSPEKGP